MIAGDGAGQFTNDNSIEVDAGNGSAQLNYDLNDNWE